MSSADLPLGRDVAYVTAYTPSLLCSVDRGEYRAQSGIANDPLPFQGQDVWNCYELSWLETGGRPEVAGVRLHVPCTSVCIVESKSLKLYFNSFAQTAFASRTEVLNTLTADLSLAFRGSVLVELIDLNQLPLPEGRFPGVCLDDLDLTTDIYRRQPDLLKLDSSDVQVRETLHTHLFRSICPVTGQPDWASIMVQYAGPAIDQAGLLKYLISYREHAAFHEDATERIFMDVLERCGPDRLTVHARFLRRGGIDINPFRSMTDDAPADLRLPRQ